MSLTKEAVRRALNQLANQKVSEERYSHGVKRGNKNDSLELVDADLKGEKEEYKAMKPKAQKGGSKASGYIAAIMAKKKGRPALNKSKMSKISKSIATKGMKGKAKKDFEEKHADDYDKKKKVYEPNPIKHEIKEVEEEKEDEAAASPGSKSVLAQLRTLEQQAIDAGDNDLLARVRKAIEKYEGMEGGSFTGGSFTGGAGGGPMTGGAMRQLGYEYGRLLRDNDELVNKHGGDFWKDFKQGFKMGLDKSGDVLGKVGSVASLGHFIPTPVTQSIGVAGDVAQGVGALAKWGSNLIGDGPSTGGAKMNNEFYDEMSNVKVVGEGKAELLGTKESTYAPKRGRGRPRKNPPKEKKETKAKKSSARMKKRGEIIKKLMKEHGMKLGEASKYIKEHNLM